MTEQEMKAIVAAAEKLVRCKGRYHSEQNYRALAALFGVTVPDLEPLAGEGNPSVIPNGWVKCCERMPETDDFVQIWPIADFGVDVHIGQYIKFHKSGPGWFVQINEQNHGIEWYPVKVTHWQPLPPSPES